MPIRYRLLPFTQNEIASPQAAKSFLEALAGFQDTPTAQLSTLQWISVLRHALNAGADAILLQDAVRDPDFREEYDAFYSRQQQRVSSLCKRLHFFRVPAPLAQPQADTENEDEILLFVDTAASATQACYLGFVTLRPLRHAPVGASILVHDKAPITCLDEFPVHIAGREFTVRGTPYLQQDNAVGACAQASIWVALRTLRRRLGNSAYSPAELTVAATKHLTFNRVFPGRQGLTTIQMLEAIRAAGHDPLIVEPIPTTPDSSAKQAIEFGTPYLESGLPVIVGLKSPAGDGHAVVAIGFVPTPPGATHPDTFTIHNDNTGCYLPLPSQAPGGVGYALEQTTALITLLPEGICQTASEAETLAISAIRFGAALLEQSPPIKSLNGNYGAQVTLALRVFLSTRHAFRSWATGASDLDQATKTKYRTSELPKFIWVAELHELALFERGKFTVKSRLGEVVLDASADALHGDALIFTRLSGLSLGAGAPTDGILLVEKEAGKRDIIAIDAPRTLPQTQPWS